MKKWIAYITILGFTSYWASNLMLWFPWSYSPTLGITLMLTLGVALWAFVSVLALTTYPGTTLLNGAVLIALVFLFLSVLMDYVFFGLIRNAMDQLYHLTTFYGYGFLLVWPIILAILFKKKMIQRKKSTTKSAMTKAGTIGLICFGALTLIIILGIEITG